MHKTVKVGRDTREETYTDRYINLTSLTYLHFPLRPDTHNTPPSLVAHSASLTPRRSPGPDLSDLYITTASANQSYPELVPQYPQGGDLFRVRIDGVKGVERFKFAG